MSSLDIPKDLPVFKSNGDQLLPTSLAIGPWYPGTQHGSSMLLLAAIAAERYPSEIPRQVTRLTVDMMRAAPIAPIDIVSELRKGGRNMEVLDVSIQSQGKECVRVSALRFRIEEIPVAERLKFNGNNPKVPPPLEEPLFRHIADKEGFHNAIDIRVDMESSPAIAWFHLKQPVVDNLPITPLQRVALAADWTYSIPNIANRITTGESFGGQSFYGINPDTTLNLHRRAEGEWIGIQTHATYDDLGCGTVMGQIFDEKGPVGFSTQSILIRGADAAPLDEKERQQRNRTN